MLFKSNPDFLSSQVEL